MAKLEHDGRLERLAGKVAACTCRADGLEVTLRLADGTMRTTTYDAIVRCIGPALLRSDADAPVIRALVDSGNAVADPAGLGIVTDADGRVASAANTFSDRLFTLGALRRASSWETTAVPDISVHAATLARMLTR